jgi:hypothetical protein
MTRLLRSCLFALVLVWAGPALAQTAPDAATAFAERSALAQAAQRCGLLSPAELHAVQAGASQARGALLRGGWDGPRVDALAQRASAAGARRACDDPALLQAAGQARAGYAAWARMPTMQFPGVATAWIATRAPDPEGWLLRQTGRAGAVLGVRLGADGPLAALTVPLAAGSPEPAFAVISFRDATRAAVSLAELPGRAGQTLAAFAAPPAQARQVWAQERTILTLDDGRRIALLTFPASAFDGTAALDPREAIEVRIGRAGSDRGVRLYFEVGDLAAALSFLAAQPTPQS